MPSLVSPLTEAREAIVAALEPLGVTIYGVPPESGVTPPAAVVLPGTPWTRQATFDALAVTYQVTLMATMSGNNASALERIETLSWDALSSLTPVGTVSGPDAPRIVRIGPGEFAASDLTVQVHVTT